MFRIGIILFVLFIVGCTATTNVRPVDDYVFLHDNSSKVWVVDKLMADGKDFTPIQFEYKDVVVFHVSRNAYFNRLKEFGEKPGVKMSFWIDRSENEVGFSSAKKEFVFSISQISRTKIVLKPKRKSYPYTMVLVPFPEF